MTLRTSRGDRIRRNLPSWLEGRTSCASPAVRINIRRFSAMVLCPEQHADAADRHLPLQENPSSAFATPPMRNPRRHVRRGRECAAERAVAAAIRVLTLDRLRIEQCEAASAALQRSDPAMQIEHIVDCFGRGAPQARMGGCLAFGRGLDRLQSHFAALGFVTAGNRWVPQPAERGNAKIDTTASASATRRLAPSRPSARLIRPRINLVSG